MRNPFTTLICAVAVTSCILAGCVTRPVVNGIPNFAEVKSGIYRGGQPNQQGWQFLRSLGVTNVIKLNGETAETSPDEMIVRFIPLPPETILDVFQKPRSNDVARAVHLMQREGTYVHCEYGRDRTGLVVGCYRIWVNSWSESAAAREMSDMGYRWSLPGLTAFWKSVTPVMAEDENK